MPWPVRSRRLYALSSVSVGASIFYLGTVPGDYTYIVKDIVVYNWAGSSRSFAIWAKVDGNDHVIAHVAAVAAAQSVVWQQRSIVLHAGDNFGISAGTTGATGLYVSGARLGTA